MYSFRENLTTDSMDILVNGYVEYSIPMVVLKHFKFGFDDFIKYPEIRRRIFDIVGTKRLPKQVKGK